ncbi:uncharacterized protein LOC133200567 [Saccostrea echinata]|uniref:uncharacterized protein LOC133200567 n=1 Tax=Saccostrea echinata TaxID=191078 RepID=UPI002A8028C4|nr:uncharacterized protein LOC133200567 [Saccostrea echinata]
MNQGVIAEPGSKDDSEPEQEPAESTPEIQIPRVNISHIRRIRHPLFCHCENCSNRRSKSQRAFKEVRLTPPFLRDLATDWSGFNISVGSIYGGERLPPSPSKSILKKKENRDANIVKNVSFSFNLEDTFSNRRRGFGQASFSSLFN